MPRNRKSYLASVHVSKHQQSCALSLINCPIKPPLSSPGVLSSTEWGMGRAFICRCLRPYHAAVTAWNENPNFSHPGLVTTTYVGGSSKRNFESRQGQCPCPEVTTLANSRQCPMQILLNPKAAILSTVEGVSSCPGSALYQPLPVHLVQVMAYTELQTVQESFRPHQLAW